MICPNCGVENPEGRRFCEECGEKMTKAMHEREVSRRKTTREAARVRRDAEAMGMDAETLERRRRSRARKTKPWMGLVLLAAIVLIVVLVVVFATSTSLSAPEKAVHDFFGALKKNDFVGVLKNIDVETYEQIKKGALPTSDAQAYIGGYDRYEVKDLKTELVSQTGDQAVVRVTGGWFQGFWNDSMPPSIGVDFAKYPRSIQLQKIDNRWVIQNYPEAMSPAPLPESSGGESEFPETEGNP